MTAPNDLDQWLLLHRTMKVISDMHGAMLDATLMIWTRTRQGLVHLDSPDDIDIMLTAIDEPIERAALAADSLVSDESDPESDPSAVSGLIHVDAGKDGVWFVMQRYRRRDDGDLEWHADIATAHIAWKDIDNDVASRFRDYSIRAFISSVRRALAP